MSSHPQQQDDVQALRRLKTADFTVYRRGAAIFNLESRVQGHIRKVTQATFKESIMTDDGINITLVSTESMSFKMRDYIVYDGRPYFLNRLPSAVIDGSKRYTYTMVFEGAMFELGRVAFILRNAIGYDFYGTLPEFARLVVENMNRINMWVEWTYQGNSYKAKFKRVEEVYHGSGDAKVTKQLYMWGIGFNGDMEGLGERFIYTDGIPVVGGNATSPEEWVFNMDTGWSLAPISGIVITALHQWTLDFPVATEIPTQYPTPSTHIPDNVDTYGWCDVEDAIKDNYSSIISAYINDGTWWEYTDNIGAHERGVDCELVADSVVEGTIPQAQGIPTSPIDTYDVQQPIQFQLKYTPWEMDVQQDEQVFGVAWYDTIHINRKVTYTAELTSQTQWQVDPVVPQEGSVTTKDFPTESVLLAYDNHSCLAVLQDLSSKWEDWEWRISDDVEYGFVNGQMLVCGTIVMRQRTGSGDFGYVHVMDFGRSGGISSLKRSDQDDGNIPSRVYFYGGSQNLPQYYRNTRLCLPNYTKENSYIDFSEIDWADWYKSHPNESVPLYSELANDNVVCEEIKIFDDIYPACKPFTIKQSWGIDMDSETISKISGTATKHYLQITIPMDEFFLINDKWKSFDEQVSPYPDYLEWLMLRQQTNTEENRLRYATYYAGTSKYQNGTDEPYIVFQTGDIAGFKLSIHDTYIDVKNNVIVLLLNVVTNNNEEFRDAETEIPEAEYTPNEDLICHHGDKFIVEGINMPVAYTYYKDGSDADFSAENALWRAAMDYMCSKAENIKHEIEVADDYVRSHKEEFRCFDGIQFSDIDENKTVLRRRVSSVELDLVNRFRYRIEITNVKRKNAIAILGKLVSQHNNV